MRPFARVILIVIDSLGAGELPDAAAYGDEGSDTLGNLARVVPLDLPHMRALGLGRVAALNPAAGARIDGVHSAAWPRPRPGKDSVTGHWEMAGIVLERPFPTFPDGFPRPVIEELEARIGRRTLGNVVASGTEIIDRLGAEHMATGRPIVYTSADSVLQIAAHEDVIPIAELYRICEAAFEIAGRGLGVGRVIARPFEGRPGAFRRTVRRHDYALEPTGPTLLDALCASRTSRRVDRQGERPLCRPGRLPLGADDERRRRHGAGDRRAGVDGGRAAVREPGGLRHAARAPQRSRRATPATSKRSTAGWEMCCHGSRRTTSSW